MTTADVLPAPTLAPVPAPVAPLTPKQEKRLAKREAETARAVSLALATRSQRDEDRTARAEDGYSGREGYTAWLGDVKRTLLASLDGVSVTMTAARVDVTRAGVRILLLATAEVEGHTVEVRGETTARQSVVDPSGATCHVKLTLDASGKVPCLRASGTGETLTVRDVRVSVRRHVRIAVSAI